MKAVRHPFEMYWEERALPLLVSKAALLPFEGTIVTDSWLVIRPIVFGGSISRDIDDAYEEAKHQFGIIETLPRPTSKRSNPPPSSSGSTEKQAESELRRGSGRP